MTYRNKLRIRRLLLILLIAAVIVFLLLLIGFTYLGRYVVYTEDGAHFSFHAQAPVSSTAPTVELPSTVELITGSPISSNEVIGEAGISLKDSEVQGVLVDYAALSDGRTLNSIELSADGNNTLVLEMKTRDGPMLSSTPVSKLIDRAKSQDTWLVAILACLGDSDYALEHIDQALRIDGGALWISNDGTYFLDPANEDAIKHVAEMVKQLADMGFDEVILNDFYMPISSSLSYDYGDQTAAEIAVDAYNSLVEQTIDYCDLGLLVQAPYEGHQLFYTADRIYVCYEDGGSVKEYADTHPDQYLVFITSSHDTRFDGFGKVEADSSFTEEAVPEGTVVIEPYTPPEERVEDEDGETEDETEDDDETDDMEE